MANDYGQPLDEIVKRLMKQTGITEAQALELVYRVGLNWPSLVRQAKALKVGKS
ncbi:hypothetical protein [Mesorhizobium sp. RIZ17]|jgi:hypothetical protein|uniref:hypothetical protein n=1 Tax=Mesorhizobium sp. RIZ17 TaxID=3132743 RepID=UPI003DA855A3